VGLITKEQYDRVLYKEKVIQEETTRLKAIRVGAAAENQAYLRSIGSTELKTAVSLAELLSRPEMTYENLRGIDPDHCPVTDPEIAEEVEINIKYEGYIERQKKQVEQFNRLEGKKIPADIDYDDVTSLRLEARQKLKELRPASIGQASRMSGVTPADVAVLLIYLDKQRAERKA
jgi:tRNA uridine 5-carboxymethylaminomethyl modification enzyme